jgi:hypothetical protein
VTSDPGGMRQAGFFRIAEAFLLRADKVIE